MANLGNPAAIYARALQSRRPCEGKPRTIEYPRRPPPTFAESARAFTAAAVQGEARPGSEVARVPGEAAPVVPPPVTVTPVCSVCNDAHMQHREDRTVMCTACPTPCQKCRQGGNGPYCEQTPCTCRCHAKTFIASPADGWTTLGELKAGEVFAVVESTEVGAISDDGSVTWLNCPSGPQASHIVVKRLSLLDLDDERTVEAVAHTIRVSYSSHDGWDGQARAVLAALRSLARP